MNILHVTNMYPCMENDSYGIFVKDQIDSIREENRNGNTDVYYINGIESKLNYLKAIIFLKRNHRKYEIIHCHHGWTGIITHFSCGNKKKKVISLVGGDVLERKIPYKKILIKMVRHIIPKFHHVVVKSLQMKNNCQKLNTNISILPNGVKLDVFKELDKHACRERLKLKNDMRYFLFVAASNKHNRIEKRMDIAEDAIKLLKTRYGNIVELVVLNSVKHEDVPVYLNACDAVLLCSDYEGSPNIVKEAMACNIPVISTDVGDVNHLLSGVSNCRIVNQNPEVFADTIEQLFLSSSKVLRTNGRERLKTLQLDDKSVAINFIKLYKSIIGEEL